MIRLVINKYSPDKKNLSILFAFLTWLLVGFIIMLVGVNDVFALVINSSFMGTSIDNEFNITSGSYKSANTSITVDESNALNYLVVDICSTMHGSYSISNISNSSGNVSFYKGYYISGTCALANYNGAHIRLYYKVNSWADAGNGNYGLIFSSRFNNTASYTGYVKVNSIYTLDTLDSTVANIEQSEKLNSSIQNSTDTITGSITDSENNINQNIDDMEQSIIDNQNSNTDKEIESQKICDFIDKSNIKENGKFLNASGVLTNYADSGVTDYININGAEVITLTNVSSVNGVHLCYYTVNKELISCVNSATTINEPLNLPQNAYYMRSTILTTYNRPTYQICKNGNQGLNDKLDNLQGAITDSSAPNTGALENSAGWLPPGPLDSILNLPLSMLNSISNSLSKSCIPMALTLPFINYSFELPCINTLIQKMGGNNLWTWIGSIASILILYTYLLNLYSWVDKKLSLKEENYEGWGGV